MSCLACRRSASDTRSRTKPSPRSSSTRSLVPAGVESRNAASVSERTFFHPSYKSRTAPSLVRNTKKRRHAAPLLHLRLFRIVDGAAFADNNHFYLAGILHFILDLLGNVMRQNNGAASSTISGTTITRISRPACMAYVRSTPLWAFAISSNFSRRFT